MLCMLWQRWRFLSIVARAVPLSLAVWLLKVQYWHMTRQDARPRTSAGAVPLHCMLANWGLLDTCWPSMSWKKSIKYLWALEQDPFIPVLRVLPRPRQVPSPIVCLRSRHCRCEHCEVLLHLLGNDFDSIHGIVGCNSFRGIEIN